MFGECRFPKFEIENLYWIANNICRSVMCFILFVDFWLLSYWSFKEFLWCFLDLAILTAFSDNERYVAKIKEEFANYDRHTLDHIWAHLYACWRSILCVDGSNQYKAPHSKARTRGKNAPTSVDLTIDVVEYTRVSNMLNELQL